MSATYLLAHVSPKASTSNLSTDAIWCSNWSTLPGGNEIVITAGADHKIRVWNPKAGKVPSQIIKPSCLGIVGLAVDPSEAGATFLISSSLDSVIARYNLIDGIAEAAGRVEFGPAETWSVALNPKNSHLATAGMNSVVKILSSATENFGELITTMNGSGNFGLSIEYSEDGRLVAVASDTGTISLFDTTTGTLVSSFQAHAAPIRSLQFTSNLLITASDDKRINIFDLRALTNTSSAGGGRKGLVASLGGHEGWVVSLNARNDRLLASGSSDGTVKLWDLSQPTTALTTLRDATGDVWTMSWKPDAPTSIAGLSASAAIGGGELLTGGEDGILRWWRGGG